jgi:HAD superfamily hydrolase (TIGR01509 family)
MKTFKAIIFDCDGVLIDSEIIANRVEVEVKNEFGFPITIEEQLKTFVGLSKNHPVMQAELKRLPPAYWQVVDDRCKAAYLKDLKSIDGVTDALEKLTLPKCVASSSEPDWLAFKLKHTKLDRHFLGAVFSGSMVQQSKPAPDLFLLALEKMRWRSEDTLVVEDSVAGVEAGKAAGLTVWGFLGGSHIYPGHKERLLQSGADHIFSDFQDILRAVQ